MGLLPSYQVEFDEVQRALRLGHPATGRLVLGRGSVMAPIVPQALVVAPQASR
ncbi:MAG TPA: hypothetical protein VEQ66_00865 [Propionibacteriaceae bacterium]|nr:hypothetical protein [Propionibacteriaceae bacterium]